jgi:hypothetical protein
MAFFKKTKKIFWPGTQVFKTGFHFKPFFRVFSVKEWKKKKSENIENYEIWAEKQMITKENEKGILKMLKRESIIYLFVAIVFLGLAVLYFNSIINYIFCFVFMIFCALKITINAYYSSMIKNKETLPFFLYLKQKYARCKLWK